MGAPIGAIAGSTATGSIVGAPLGATIGIAEKDTVINKVSEAAAAVAPAAQGQFATSRPTVALACLDLLAGQHGHCGGLEP